MNFGPHVVFRQLFDAASSTYTYLLADASSRDAILIDPVIEHSEHYLQLLKDLALNLLFAIDTHTHADHITALGRLREHTQCQTLLGEQSQSECVSKTLRHGEVIPFGALALTALHTPGHTDDSYSFAFSHNGNTALFTGDTLLIRGTGRTDFQQGDAATQYRSLFDTLLRYDDHTWVYPGHDYKGWQVSSIGEEKRCNPRLQVSNIADYVQLMNNLKLPNPKLMDIAVPANQACGQR